jgi:hypothetical protein
MFPWKSDRSTAGAVKRNPPIEISKPTGGGFRGASPTLWDSNPGVWIASVSLFLEQPQSTIRAATTAAKRGQAIL